ncbi:MAG: hypothetical protein QNK37_11530 [Acidobacteriota bacterium]|nr:hypothetical protein [Acidobacteriota bacterium]
MGLLFLWCFGLPQASHAELARLMSNSNQGLTEEAGYIRTSVSFIDRKGLSMVIEERYFDGVRPKPNMTERKIIPLAALHSIDLMDGKATNQERNTYLLIRYRSGKHGVYRFEQTQGVDLSPLVGLRLGVYSKQRAADIKKRLDELAATLK